MPQSNIIFFYLLAFFVVFITARGELPVYLGFLLATPQQPNGIANPATPPQQAGNTSSQGTGLSTAISTLQTGAEAFALLA